MFLFYLIFYCWYGYGEFVETKRFFFKQPSYLYYLGNISLSFYTGQSAVLAVKRFCRMGKPAYKISRTLLSLKPIYNDVSVLYVLNEFLFSAIFDINTSLLL